MGEFFIQRADNGVWYGQFHHFIKAGIRHAVSTRLGGVSTAFYTTLNLGMHTGDDKDAVAENRRRFCEAAGVRSESVVTAQQVHSDHIVKVTGQDAGKGAFLYEAAFPETDALMTNERGLSLMLFFADCVPVLIADPVHKVIAAVHAGWKGSMLKIAHKTLLAMKECYGADIHSCLVGIGPSIGSCCYEVDGVVIKQLKSSFTNWQQFVTPHDDKYMLDLWEVNRRQLIEAGVPERNIAVSKVCTACNANLFYSHRKEQGKTGRIGAVISL